MGILNISGVGKMGVDETRVGEIGQILGETGVCKCLQNGSRRNGNIPFDSVE